MPLDWSILRSDGPVDIAGNFARGFQIGETLVDKFHENNALAALTNNPDDQMAMRRLYAIDPRKAAIMEEMNMKRHDYAREGQARSALSDFMLAQPGMNPHGLTGAAPPIAPTQTAPTPSFAAASPSVPGQASDAPITITAPRTSAVPMSDSWASFVHNDPENAMKFLLDRAKLGKDQAETLAGQFDVMARLAQSATDEPSYQNALQQAKEQGWDVSHLPPHFDPAAVQSILRQAMSAKEYLTLQHNIADDEADNAETERNHDLQHQDRVRGQDVSDDRGRRGQDIAHEDRVRGQDIDSEDRRRGQDKSSEDRRRGQDKGGGKGSARPTIIVNPKTGERMKLEGGKWVPA